jgi:hypothetical protein
MVAIVLLVKYGNTVQWWVVILRLKFGRDLTSYHLNSQRPSVYNIIRRISCSIATQHRVLFVHDGAPLCFTWYMKQFLDPHYPDRWIAQNRQFSLSVSHLTTCVRGVICRAQFTEAELTCRRSFGVWLRQLRQYGTWPAGTGNSWYQSSVLCTQANAEYFKLLS